ncbi:MAG: hypothetical protein JSU02_03175, partial [Bacteroidetes bacterium]|nr:hypothetical protein [Bacteroidota bacterium]
RAVQEMAALLEQEGGEALRTKARALAMKYRNFSVAEEVYRRVYEEELAI